MKAVSLPASLKYLTIISKFKFPIKEFVNGQMLPPQRPVNLGKPSKVKLLLHKKTSIEAKSRRSDRVLAESFTEGMPEADAEALRHAPEFISLKLINSYTLKKHACMGRVSHCSGKSITLKPVFSELQPGRGSAHPVDCPGSLPPKQDQPKARVQLQPDQTRLFPNVRASHRCPRHLRLFLL